MRLALPLSCGLLVAAILAACGGSSSTKGGSHSAASESLDGEPESFDCASHSAAFEELDAETRDHLQLMCEVEAEMARYARERKSCASDGDCAVVETSCHFGCNIAVASSETQPVADKHAELKERLGGDDCTDECQQSASTACVDGTCRLR